MPRPPPSMAGTSERSSTMVRASPCEVTAARNWKAASLRTILPSHSMTAISPIFSTCTVSILFAQPGSVAVRARVVPSIHNLHFVQGKRLIQSRYWEFRARTEKICVTANAVPVGQAERKGIDLTREGKRPDTRVNYLSGGTGASQLIAAALVSD